MKYTSTRGQTTPVSFQDAVIMGQAPDGGLLLPETIPQIASELAQWRALSFQDLAVEILQLFIDDIPLADLKEIVRKSYGTFDTPEVTPLAKLKDLDIAELWHGPTLAFKDVALQFLSNVFEYVLRLRKSTLNILGATSGDTGSAAIHGVKGKENIRIFIMHPHGRTSPLQALQMTTVLDKNVFNIAVEGSFDDCQGIMKTIFSDSEFKDRYKLGAINSINWARILAQIVYYFYAYFKATASNEQRINFCVPTGNFGDIFAGYIAKRMGLPVNRLILATNENNILALFFQTGVYRRGDVALTISPSMDIQVASNFERYLFYRCGSDAAQVRTLMNEFSKTGQIKLPFSGEVDPDVIADSANTADTLSAIKKYYAEQKYVLDPHTAVGVFVAEKLAKAPAIQNLRTVCLATAHPSKFPDAIKDAVGRSDIAEHPALKGLEKKESRCAVLPNSVAEIKSFLVKSMPDC